MSPSTFEGKNRTELSIFNTNANQDQELSSLSYCNNDFLGVYTVTPKYLDIDIYYLCENFNGTSVCPDMIDIRSMVADASDIYKKVGITLNQVNTTSSYFTVPFEVYPGDVLDRNKIGDIVMETATQGIASTVESPKIIVFVVKDNVSSGPGTTHSNGSSRAGYSFLNYKNELGEKGLGPTLAHEIGHSAFDFLHPSEHPLLCNGICDNENIMFWSPKTPEVGGCCNNMTRTNDFNRLFQWAEIHKNRYTYENEK